MVSKTANDLSLIILLIYQISPLHPDLQRREAEALQRLLHEETKASELSHLPSLLRNGRTERDSKLVRFLFPQQSGWSLWSALCSVPSPADASELKKYIPQPSAAYGPPTPIKPESDAFEMKTRLLGYVEGRCRELL